MKKFLIRGVKPGTIAEEAGIAPGDYLISINSEPLKDIIDYLYLTSDEFIEVLIETAAGEEILYEIEKDPDEDLGLEFESPLLDDVKSCSNQCVFCFIDQLPQGMRKSLYFKDDDSRLSFMQGNFVTLTNLSDEKIRRIVRYRISPINVSVHTTDPELRKRLLRNPKAGRIMEQLGILAAGGITVNAQIVLMPGINDAKALDNTLRDLSALYPRLNSVAIVPIGLTRFREGLAPLAVFDPEGAAGVIAQVHAHQERFLQSMGTRFAFLADEFYLKAGQGMPPYAAYEGFGQLEDGIGMIRKFGDEVLKGHRRMVLKGRFTLITGTLAEAFMIGLAKELMDHHPQLLLRVRPITNEVFGPDITVSGLVCGRDILIQAGDISDSDALLVPDNMLKADDDLFLDDISLDQLSLQLGKPVKRIPVQGKDFLEFLRSD
ncbi:MAG: hypothetical protein AVO33_02715 [delta proteobacterium ML8_F1]|nr:MAG: hypothetical protein AVO33_02715 [delta proteobacterium ML8_F1]